jgi:hypothetical protein
LVQVLPAARGYGRCERTDRMAPPARTKPLSNAVKTSMLESPPFEGSPPVLGTAAGVTVAAAALGVGVGAAVAACVGEGVGLGLGLGVGVGLSVGGGWVGDGEGVGVNFPSWAKPGVGEAIRSAGR